MDTSQTPEPSPCASAGPGAGPDWLDVATVAISPLGDMLAVATDRRVVLLSGEGIWEGAGDEDKG